MSPPVLRTLLLREKGEILALGKTSLYLTESPGPAHVPRERTPSRGLIGGWAALIAPAPPPQACFPVTVALGPLEACGSGGCPMGTRLGPSLPSGPVR